MHHNDSSMVNFGISIPRSYYYFAVLQTWWYTDCILSAYICEKRLLQRSGWADMFTDELAQLHTTICWYGGKQRKICATCIVPLKWSTFLNGF